MGFSYSATYKTTLLQQKQISFKQTFSLLAKIVAITFGLLIAVQLETKLQQYCILEKINQRIDQPTYNIPLLTSIQTILLSIITYFLIVFSIFLKILSFILKINFTYIRLMIGGIIFCLINLASSIRKLKYQKSLQIIILKNLRNSFIITQFSSMIFLAFGWFFTFGDLKIIRENLIKSMYFHVIWNSLIIYICWNFNKYSQYLSCPKIQEQPSGKIILTKVKTFQTWNQMNDFKNKHRDD